MKNNLKDILEKLTAYFDSLFKDRKIKIIILCSIVAILLVSIISCFAISSSAAEPQQTSPPPSPDSGLYLNVYSQFYSQSTSLDSLSFSTFGFILYEGECVPYDYVEVINSSSSWVIHYIFEDEVTFIYPGGYTLLNVTVDSFDRFGETISDGYTNIVCTASMPFSLVGYWRNLGGWTVPREMYFTLLSGRILNSEWIPTGHLFANIYFGYYDLVPSEDSITFSGSQGSFSVDTDTPFYFQVTSVNPTNEWYDNAYLCYLLNVLGSDYYLTPPNVSIIESGYYSLKDEPSVLPYLSSDTSIYFDFTCPLSEHLSQYVFSGIRFTAPYSNYPFEQVHYLLANHQFDSASRAASYSLDGGDNVVNVDFQIIKIDSDVLVTTDEYSLFMNYYSNVTDDDSLIGYEQGYNNGFNNGLAQSFLENFFKGIIEALDQLTIFYGFSYLTIIQTVLGFAVLLWILKLIAGG